MTLARRVGLLAIAFLIPPTVTISGFTAWTGAQQIEDLTRRNLALELSRFRQTCAAEYSSLEALNLEEMDFYRRNAQRKMVEWAKANAPQEGFLTITDAGQRVLAPRLPPDQSVVLEGRFEPWGWTLGAGVSKRYLALFAQQALWNTFLVDLVLLVPLLFAAFALARSISRPLEGLRMAAESLTQGDFSTRATPAGAPEFQTLARSFNAMATHIEDLTASLEDRVRARTEELERSHHEMARKERMASLGSLVAGVAHEINTPLGICVTSASTLDNETTRLARLYRDDAMAQADFEGFLSTLKEGLRLLNLNLTRAHELVSSFKRLSVDQASEQLRVFAPLATLSDIVASLAHELRVAGVAVHLEGDEGLTVKGDPGLLSQVVLNWLMNSLVHGFEGVKGGEVQIRVEAQPTGLALTYGDNGRGMDQATLERLYEPFFTTRPGVGSGLGLSLVYTIIVSRFGGTIEAEGALGRGLRYRVFLPYSAGTLEPVPEFS